MKDTLFDKIAAEFAKLKTFLTDSANKPDASATAAAIAGFQVKLDAFETGSKASEKTISDLSATITTHVATIAARDGEITSLKAAAKTAGEQAVDLVAATGLDPANLPAAGAPGGGTPAKASLREQWLALTKTDSVKAAEFFASNSSKDDFWR